MRMTTWKLILLRSFNVTLGRFALANRLLRRLLVARLVYGRTAGDRYNASSRFFVMRDLD